MTATDIQSLPRVRPERQRAAPAGDQRRERDQRHGLAKHDVRQQAALGDPEPLHERWPGRGRSATPAANPTAVTPSVNRHASSTTEPDRPAAGAAPARRSRLQHGPQVRHGQVVGAAAGSAPRGRPCRRRVADRLVALPEEPGRRRRSASRAGHRGTTRRHVGDGRDDVLAVGGAAWPPSRRAAGRWRTGRRRGRLQLGQALEVVARPGRGCRTGRRSRRARSRCACCRPGRARRSRSPCGP